MEIIQEKKEYELNSRIWQYEDIREFAHWHEIIEIVHILENKCRFLVDGSFIEAKKGDLVICKEGAIHLHFREYDSCEYRLIHFPYKLFLDTKHLPGNAKVHITSEEIKEIPYLEENINAIFSMLDKQGTATTAEETPFFSYLIMAAYSELARYFPEDRGTLPIKSEKKEIYKIIEYLNSHFKEDINLQKISDALYISRSRLTRIFAKFSGIGINEYITNLRIKNANYLLAKGYSVTEAAIDSGFQSIRTFNNAYKDCMGITPSEYQKQQKLKQQK